MTATLPTLVMLPGLQGSGAFFAPFTKAAEGILDCKVISYPDRPPMGYAALEEFVRPQLPAHDYFLLGESFAGPLATVLAHKAGPNLRGLVLAATFVRNPLHHSLVPAAKIALRSMGKIIPPDAVIRAMLLDERSENMMAMTRDRIIELDEETLLTRCNEALSVDCRPELSTLGIPVLIMAAKHDRLIHKSAALEMKELAKNATYAEFDAPHYLLQTVPAETLSVIRDFMLTA